MRPLLASLITTAFICACSGGGGGSSNTDRVALELADLAIAPENENAYTVVVGIPSVSSSSPSNLYDGLASNLTTAQGQSKIPVSRVLLSVVAPNINNVFSIDNSSLSVKLLRQIASYNQGNPSKAIQVLAYPDVEAGSPWLNWPIPTSALQIPSCASAKATSATALPAQKAMLLSICWASVMNKFLRSTVISGVVYDRQSNWLKGDKTINPVQWMYTQAHNDTLLIGWISGNGVAPTEGNVDLNFIEVYDLDTSHSPFYDTVAPETVLTITEPPPVCTGGLCAFETGNARNKSTDPLQNFFPGTQYQYQYGVDINGNPEYIGAVGANIYQCAISANPAADSCTGAYTTNVDTNQPASVQMMQALNFLWNLTKQQLPASAHYGTTPNTSLAGNVIYLFSTQYIGPLKSYYGTKPLSSSGNQCADPNASSTNACLCMASLYSLNASCGGENGFGTWGRQYIQFSQFTKLFLNSQGGAYCPGQSCSTGIYMYDYIPQAWYSQ